MHGVALSSCMDPVKYNKLIENNKKQFSKNAKELGKKRNGKTLEELYGKAKANEIKRKISLANTGKSGRDIK